MARPKAIETADPVIHTETVIKKDFTIESATLHSSVMIPGIATTDALNQAKTPGIAMQLVPQGLYCEAPLKDKTIRRWIVPTANVKAMIFPK